MLTRETVDSLQEFVRYTQSLEGDEKGEAQVFCDRLFQAFGHGGYKEAGATLEYRVRERGKRTKFADLLWRPRLLLEMKKRNEKLQHHYRQTFDYWLKLVPQRPRYVVLCNFDEFWVYDFDLQLEEPVDKVPVEALPERYVALNFLFPEDRVPQFGNNRVAVTRAAADKVARVFNSTVTRGEDRDMAQRFVLQCVVALFSEDFGLLPHGIFTELIQECRDGASTYDVIGSLFRQMGDPKQARGGRFKGVPYFNGGIFQEIEPVALNHDEVELLADASSENWGKVQPQIFGTLFQSSMGKAERHALGAHFTSEADVQKIVSPTIVRPWTERVEAADTLKELLDLRQKLARFRVLDPACGAGDFLYVAYRELKRIEMDLLSKIHANFSDRTRTAVGTSSLVSPRQFYGIDVNPFGVELAKITLVLAKELALKETQSMIETAELNLPLDFMDAALPLDNLDANIQCEDALFCKWPDVDAIVGNPPYQSKNKMQQEFGPAYVSRVRNRYPEVPRRADYCVYWFRRAHARLAPGERAGLVGTNTIRQNYSREGSLDHIVHNGGTITEAVSTQVWSGEAAVHVSIVNWMKGEQSGTKRLFRQLGDRRDSDFEMVELDRIGAALSGKFDVTGAKRLRINMDSEACYQGQTHGHKGFILDPEDDSDAMRQVIEDAAARPFVHPYLIADDLLASRPPSPQRYVIDLNRCLDLFSAMESGEAYKRLQNLVMPAMEAKAVREREETGKDTGPRQTHFRRWWRFWRGRLEMLDHISDIPRYIACGRVTKRPIFEFIDSVIHPNDALQVFPLSDDYSFGILQSDIHWLWFVERCSTLKGDFRYTSDTVFDSFPWPQSPTLAQIENVAEAAVALRTLRRKVMEQNGWNYRELYRTLELPGASPLKDAHHALDFAVRDAYGMGRKDDTLTFLLALNEKLAEKEGDGNPIVGPGLLAIVEEPQTFVTSDCVRTSAQT
jgi:hypothetical protein